ncbi:hypothetical protein [Telmatospirillum siberiense]|uniref:Uncharacterized protein n=1 Tax=Telmatospirillum siberiense TaxID=382514 RepID=A0A2N3PU08_9PROT|nr:hypothetical protein [Telmatospirillum siberiense]PKU23891.1 hypothetical protein CWS72_14535 [Telmatospirillum siberiense]
MASAVQLTDDHIERFKAEQARMGLGHDQLCHKGTLSTSDHGGVVVLSPNSKLSTVPPIIVSYADFAELKAMRGIPDEAFASGRMSDAFVKYPKPFTASRMAFLNNTKNICDLDYHLEPAEYKTLQDVAQAYLMGHSAKVKEWEPLLNAAFMPGRMAVFSGENLVVKSGDVFKIVPDPAHPLDPVVLNYQTITVESGGQIQVLAKADVTSQIFNAQ